MADLPPFVVSRSMAPQSKRSAPGVVRSISLLRVVDVCCVCRTPKSVRFWLLRSSVVVIFAPCIAKPTAMVPSVAGGSTYLPWVVGKAEHFLRYNLGHFIASDSKGFQAEGGRRASQAIPSTLERETIGLTSTTENIYIYISSIQRMEITSSSDLV